jgi:hypothetical protein
MGKVLLWEPPTQLEGAQLAVKNLNLTFRSLHLPFAGMFPGKKIRMHGVRIWLGPGLRLRSNRGSVADEYLKVGQASLDEMQTRLNGDGQLPFAFTVQEDQSRDALRKAPQIGYERSGELSERNAAWPAFGQQSLERFFGVVVSEASGSAVTPHWHKTFGQAK